MRTTRAATWPGSMLRSDSRTSAKTGVAPVWTMTLAVAGHVIGVVITSSPPGPRRARARDRCIAAMPEGDGNGVLRADVVGEPPLQLGRLGPVVSQPERSVSATATISSSPTAGGWKPRKDVLGDLDSETVFDNAEAYASRGAPTRASACFRLWPTASNTSAGVPTPGAARGSRLPAGDTRAPTPDAVARLGPLHAFHCVHPAHRRHRGSARKHRRRCSAAGAPPAGSRRRGRLRSRAR